MTTESTAQASEQAQPISTGTLKKESSGNWLWGILAILLIGGGGFLLWRTFFAGGPPQGMMQGGPIPVQLDPIESEPVQQTSGFIGVLDAQQGVVLKPEIDGRITQIFVSSGATVSPGTPILEISPDRSRAELNAAQANIGAFRSALTSAEAQLRAAESERVSARAELDLQNEDLVRTETLVEEGAQAQQALDRGLRDRDRAQAALNAAIDRVDASRAAVSEARSALQQADSQASAVREDFDDTQVIAPISGVLGNIPVKLGDYVEVGDELMTITQNQNLDLEIAIPIERRAELRIGLPVEIRQPNSDQAIATGRISFISPQVNAATQSVLVKASFQNAAGLLQDDQRVEAQVIWSENLGVRVPATAVSRLGGQNFVFVAERQPDAADGEPQLIARQRLVTLGDLQDNSYEVLDGVEAGETLIVSGILNLSDGAPIMPQEEGEAAPPGGPPS
ncbi:MAG: efflux RND transporter periplasmic adaptor subunit [Elainellaceae cyanobacterium]